MLHRKSELLSARAQLTHYQTEQDRTQRDHLRTAEALLSDIQETLSTDRSDVIPRIDIPLDELGAQDLPTPRRHEPDFLFAGRFPGGDLLRFTSNAMLSDHLHTLRFQHVPISGRHRLGDVSQERFSYRRETINEDSQVVPSTFESDDLRELALRPDFLISLGRAATLLQLAESGHAVTVHPLGLRLGR